jgi:hypothetical protein
MKNHSPSLEIFLPVLNVGPEQTRQMKYHLRMDRLGEEELSDGKLDKLTEPSRAPKAYLIHPREVRQLQGWAKVGRPTEAHVTELKDYVEETLPQSWRQWMIHTPVLPMRFDRIGSRGDEALSIAGCKQTLKARSLVKQMLSNFYGPERPPRDLWMNDQRVTRPVIAQADPSSLDLLYTLGRAIEIHNEDGLLLPHTINLGGVAVEAVLPRPTSES